MRIVVSTFVALVLVPGIAPPVGAQNGTPTSADLADVASCNEEAQRRAGAPSASPGTGDRPQTLTPAPGTRTDPSGSIIAESKDPLLEGMAADGLRDPGYRTAYRDCMAARTGRR